MLALQSIDSNCVFRQTFNNYRDLKPCTLTGTGKIKQGLYSTPNQDSRITYKDTSIGNFGTKDFSVRIITKILGFNNIGSAVNIILGKGQVAATNSFGIGVNSSLNLMIYCGTWSRDYIFVSQFNITKFYDIVFTRIGTTIFVYINGTYLGTMTNPNIGANVNSNTNLFISSDATYLFRNIKQQIKLVELYSKALTANEITSLYDNSKGQQYNPIMNLKKWIKISGTFTEDYYTGNSLIIKEGQKIFTTTSGTICIKVFPLKQVVGTFEFSFYKTDETIAFSFSVIAKYLKGMLSENNQGYRITIVNNAVYLVRQDNAGTIVTLLQSAPNYIQFNIPYRIRLTNTVTGLKSLYIKGGTFKNWTLVSVTGGTGINPVTDNTYNISNCIVTEYANNSVVSDIKFYPYIL